ncbi:hypothetical protein EST62_12910 [Chlorobaculum sp. 24CR]|uniref:hypothetical protein n=1 Tax=Chlorobaculum sp. 24CR TaxID=2508878 RepID=UPI00100B5C08|nr:hypothetical protein [Chlorobaculum sp. 24CR]RXK80201.1 hypothetical protein EST62_12910 [Chlorobaculum sp. 24CR]
MSAWAVMEPYFAGTVDGLIARSHEAESKRLGSENLFDIAKAGNVLALLLDRQSLMPGRIDPTSAEIMTNEEDQAYDLFEDLSLTVLAKGG